MIDPITLLGPIATVAGLVAKIAIDLTSFISSTNDVPGQISQLSQQVNIFQAVILQLQRRFEPQDHGYTEDQMKILNIVINTSLDVLGRLTVTIAKCKRSSTTLLLGRMKWKFNEHEIASYRSELTSCTSILSLMTSSLTEQRVARIEELLHRVIEEMRTSNVPFESQTLPPAYTANRPTNRQSAPPSHPRVEPSSAATTTPTKLSVTAVQEFVAPWSAAFLSAHMTERRLFGDQEYEMPNSGTVTIKSDYQSGIAMICLVSGSSYVELHACEADNMSMLNRRSRDEFKATVDTLSISYARYVHCWVRALNGRKTSLSIHFDDSTTSTPEALPSAFRYALQRHWSFVSSGKALRKAVHKGLIKQLT